MKLLLDQNISHRLIAKLIDSFPDSSHVTYLGMADVSDIEIWKYAQKHNFSIVTQDADFHEHCLLYGGPPLIIWLKSGNQPKQVTLEKLLKTKDEIEHTAQDPNIWCIEIY